MGTTRSSDAGAAALDAEWSALMARAQGGDRVAYARLLRECTPLVRRVVRHRGIKADRLDDVVQEVLLTVHRARQTFDPTRSFSAWLCTIAQRRAVDAMRRSGRHDRYEVSAPIEYENYADSTQDSGRDGTFEGQGRGVREMIDQLPAAQREALDALALRQLSLEEASVQTGKTKGALKVNLHRALKTLRVRFGGDE